MDFWEKKFLPLFRPTLNFENFTKNRDCGEILLSDDLYPSAFYFTRVLLSHVSGLISTFLNIDGLVGRAWTIKIIMNNYWKYSKFQTSLLDNNILFFQVMGSVDRFKTRIF